MAVTHDYKCPKHGYFESKKAQCPMKDCHEEVLLVFLQAPNMVSAKTRPFQPPRSALLAPEIFS